MQGTDIEVAAEVGGMTASASKNQIIRILIAQHDFLQIKIGHTRSTLLTGIGSRLDSELERLR